MRRVNIILKAFGGEYHNTLVTEALQGFEIGTCICINDCKDFMPDIQAERMEWMSGRPLRAGDYAHVDWNTIDPVDEKLIEEMQHCEMRFLSMAERYGLYGDIPYRERKRQYLAHLRYWSHTLDHENIGLYLLYHAPHQCYDFVIFELCKLKGIPTFLLDHFFSVNSITLVDDYENSGLMVHKRFEELKEQYENNEDHIPLCDHYEEFFLSQTTKDVSALPTPVRDKNLAKKSFASKWISVVMTLIVRKPLTILKAVTSMETWSRKWKQHMATRYYDTNAKEPNYDVPFIYVPLHMQPEEAVSPRGGGFENQELVVQMLASLVPEGVQIYVKEHPNQGELCRNKYFYESMNEIPNVTLVPRNTSTFRLMKDSKAVGTITGTAGFESLFRGKPVIMFGHRFYQFAPGVFTVHSIEDCKVAIDSIFGKDHGISVSAREMRLFMKAMEDVSSPYLLKPKTEEEIAIQDKYIQKTGEMMQNALAPIFS